MIRSSSAPAWLLCALVALCPSPARSAPDDIQEARRLHAQGSLPAALDRVEAALSRQPRDARARFLKGVILSEQGRQADAIRIFTALTEEFPELPEPYNNLAVLYAAQGQDDKARKALEAAIRTHPSYATAHENLGDIYAKMAREAYDKALQLDAGNASARAKLALVKDLFSRTGGGAPPVRTVLADPPASQPPTVTPPAGPAVPPPAAPVPGAAARPAAPAVSPTPVLPAKPPAAAEPPARNEGPAARETPADAQAEVLRALQGWARAWSAGDAAQYLGHYAPGFRPPGGQSRADWEQARRERVARGRRISVQVLNAKVSFSRPDEAVVTFRQSYQSESMRVVGRKRMTLVRSASRWLILHEEVVR